MQFGTGNPRRSSGRIRGALFVTLFVAAAVLFVILLNGFGRSTLEREQESLEKAIHRDLIQCYSLEGFYPSDISYLCDHYGLIWDPDTFFVDYEPIGSNLYPDVTVLLRRNR